MGVFYLVKFLQCLCLTDDSLGNIVNNIMPSKYDIYCPAQPDKICSAKAEIVGEFTGDKTGNTSLSPEEEAASFLLDRGLRNRSRLSEAQGCEAPIAGRCPVQEDVSDRPGRKLYTTPARWVLSRLVR